MNSFPQNFPNNITYLITAILGNMYEKNIESNWYIFSTPSMCTVIRELRGDRTRFATGPRLAVND